MHFYVRKMYLKVPKTQIAIGQELKPNCNKNVIISVTNNWNWAICRVHFQWVYPKNPNGLTPGNRDFA